MNELNDYKFINESIPSTPSYNNTPPTQDRILNSKLPDEIKKLMIENPIEKPNVPGLNTSFLSEDVKELLNYKKAFDFAVSFCSWLSSSKISAISFAV